MSFEEKVKRTNHHPHDRLLSLPSRYKPQRTIRYCMDIKAILNTDATVKCRLKRLLLIFLLFLPEIAFAEVKTPTNPNSAKACAICHYRWIDTFFIDGKGTELVDYTSEKVVASPEMCNSCHDGSVADSRRKAYKNHTHKIGIPTSKDIKIPDLFPLGENNSLQCATCHTPHALPSGAGAEDSIFMRASNKNSAMCLKCHADKHFLTETKHNLFYSAAREANLEGQTVSEAGPCSACHLQHTPARFFLEQEIFSTQLCFSCHSEGNIAESFRLTGKQHPFNSQPAMNRAKPTLPLFTSNNNQIKKGLITCSTCHDPHRWNPDSNIGEIRRDVKGDRTNSFLRRPSPTLCADCHSEKSYIEKTDHDLTIAAPDSKNIVEQEPIKSGVCGVCHLVHNSKNEIFLWAQGFGPGNNIMEKLCNACHTQGGSAKSKIPKVYLHPREKLITNTGKQNFFPLFHAVTGELVARGNLSCPSCHNVHQWNSATAAPGEGTNEEGTLSNSFLRPRTSFELCTECHKKDAQLKFEQFHNNSMRRFVSFEEQFFQ